MSNTAEGFERGNPDEFLYFLKIAKSSAAEVGSQLQEAFDHGHVTEREMQDGIDLRGNRETARGDDEIPETAPVQELEELQGEPCRNPQLSTFNSKPETHNRLRASQARPMTLASVSTSGCPS